MSKIDEMASAFSTDIDSVSKSLTVVSGEAVCYIYNHPAVRKSLLAAQRRGVNMRFMLSPIICVEDERTNTLIDILGAKNVKVFRRMGRALIHYRVMDGERVYMEEPHLAAASAEERKPISVDEHEQTFWAERLEDEFDDLISKRMAQQIASENELIPLQQADIRELRDSVEKKGRSFDFLSSNDLRLLLSV